MPSPVAAESAPSDATIAAAEKSVLTLTNRRRVDAGLVGLRWDSRLGELARDRAAYMAKTGQFSHTQSNGTDVFDMIASMPIRERQCSGAASITAAVAVPVKTPADSPLSTRATSSSGTESAARNTQALISAAATPQPMPTLLPTGPIEQNAGDG